MAAQESDRDSSQLAQIPELPGLPQRAPWYVRRPRLAGLAAGAGALAILGGLAGYAWQTLRLTELDRVKISVPAVPLGYQAVERPAAVPPAPAVVPSQPRVAPPAAKVARPSSPASARPAVTHTKGSQAGASAGVFAAPPAARPASDSRCAEGVAALGLCATRSEGAQ
jgi:hypothetical protein